uniref:Helicase C-terminal domain-containing protein n=1 Tax=Leersia perrieri TaxID=77586 RepID=A0A0D9XPP5_9ORYZ
MAAPHPSIIIDDDDDDGFDWEAAVREIDLRCALASASADAAAASGSAPPPEPSAAMPSHPIAPSAAAAAFSRAPVAGARQSTLYRFVDSFTRRQMANERPIPVPAAAPSAAAPMPVPVAPSGGWGRPGDRAGEGCSSVPPSGSWGGPSDRAGEGCSGRVDEYEPKPCAVDLDHEAVLTWIYPTNVEVREYQKYFVQKALLTNTLVALPTGLGKTFIAAVVMYNYFRWFPQGKIVFTAPTRPLVTQQIEACHNTVGIPQEWTIDLKGNLSPSKRSWFWKSKRVFFVTPQLEAARVPLRILALTATPGSKQPAIQNVINNLRISELVHRDESDPEVSRYVHRRTVEILEIPVGREANEVNDKLLDVIRPYLAQLRSAGVIDNRNASNWSSHQLRMLKDKFDQAPPLNIPLARKKEIGIAFAALTLLYGILKMLFSYGIKAAHQSIEAKYKEGPWKVLARNNTFWEVKKTMENFLSQGVLSPKVQKLMEVLVDHFRKNSKDSRVIIFAHYRECVNEILCSLRNIDGELVRPAAFIGQSSTGDQLKGQTQKMQQAILHKFRSGEHNILVATSIGEEGLDIMEVDLVVCFDANISALRMIQRMGRTGRKNEGRVDILLWMVKIDNHQRPELSGYRSKQGNTKTMKKLLRDHGRFEYHASPRMVPHVYKPEVKFVKLSIEKYIPSSKKSKVDVNGTSPIFNKISEEDSQLIAQYFGACNKKFWKPSLVTFPSFQVSPCDIYKVPHSFRTTNMLIDAMQQLQDLSFSRTKCACPLNGPADVPVVMDEVPEGLSGSNGTQGPIPQEYCGLEASGEAAWSKAVLMPSSPIKKYPVHSFFSGDYVTVDLSGFVSITFVPALPRRSELHEGTVNVNWHQKVQSKTASLKLAPNMSRPMVEFDCSAGGGNSSKLIFTDEYGLAPHSPAYTEKCGHIDDRHVLGTPSKTLVSPKEICHTPCNSKLVNPGLSGQEDMELSPRLTYYIEEGIVPESPMLEVSQLQVEAKNAANVGFLHKVDFSKSRGKGVQVNELKCRNRQLNFEEKGSFFDEISALAVLPRENALDQPQANKEERTHLSNDKMHSPGAHTPTANLLYDSFSDDWQLRPGGDTSGSIQEAPKYRRLCKYGDKIKRVSSMSLDDRYDRTAGEICDFATKNLGNQRRAKRRMDTFIDDEAEVSADADVSADEDNDHSEDKYEESFIDDQATPTGQFTQSGRHSENNGDMMAFYRRSLLTQSPVVLPSCYQDAVDSSASKGGNASSSSENLHNSIETPQGIHQPHHTIDPDVLDNSASRGGSVSCYSKSLHYSIETPQEIHQPHHNIGPSPLGDQARFVGRASSTKEQCEASLAHCESSTTLDCRKRKLSFQQVASIPVINLEPEPAPQPFSHLNTGVNNNFVWDDDDDDFFESLDLDAIEAQATELWKLKKAQSAEKTYGN